jgi:hypothetical protein
MSSKRNQFKITRGALGDAFKELLSIPYALAIEGLGFDKWEKPLIIRDSASRKEFTVKLKVDKANQGIEPIFAVEDLSSAGSRWYYLSSLYRTQNIHEIQVDLFLPFDSRSAAESMIRKFKDLLNQYLYNTHIVFNFRIDDPANRNIWMNLETQQAQEIITNAQKNNNNKKLQERQQQHLTSIHYYTFTEFENLLYGLEDNNALAYDKLYRIFRECTNLKKTDELKSLTVGELKNTAKDTKLRLFRSLRNALPPKEKLDLPLGVSSKSKDRKAAIKKRIEQMGYSVINFNHKCIEGHAKYTRQDLKGSEAAGIAAATANENFDNTVQFPFLFEAAIATVVGNFNRKVHQLINNSPRYNTNSIQSRYWGKYV